MDEKTPTCQLQEYRSLLQELEQKSQESYDKSVLTLSAGALGVSFTVFKEFVGKSPDNPWLLLSAWICWGASCCCIIASFLTSQKAMSKAIEKVDDGDIGPEIGGRLQAVTSILNYMSGSLFVIGVILFSFFCFLNIL